MSCESRRTADLFNYLNFKNLKYHYHDGTKEWRIKWYIKDIIRAIQSEYFWKDTFVYLYCKVVGHIPVLHIDPECHNQDEWVCTRCRRYV